jgi:hypothetical protein
MASSSSPKRIALSITALCALASCGAPSREQARDRATTHSCDWYASCGEIGSGQTYETRDACDVDVRSSWNDLWPAADCSGTIDGDALDVCLKAIDITDCANGFDFFNTVFNKCGKDKVCTG